jgi:SNF2 family DNA or RNA helicase
MSDLALHDYQIVARDFLRGRGRAALFLDMGLGKTAAALSALEDRHLPALVVAPKRVAENVWPHEASLWRPDLRVAVAAGSPAERRAQMARDVDIVVIGRDNLRDVLSEPPRPRPYRTVIVDELSGFKNRASVRWKTARKIVADKHVESVWGLTGTPSPNGLIDIWAQIYLLDSGARLGKNITTYRNRYFYPGAQLANGVITEWIPREETPGNVERLLSDICLSMETDGRIELPPVTHNRVSVDLPPQVQKVYQRMKNDLVVDLREIFDGEIHSAANAAVLTSKLAQISAGFMYVDDADLRNHQYTILHREKVLALQEIVEGTGSPVLVFYRFQAELEMIRAALPTAQLVSDPGVIDSWNAGRVPVMLAHPASAGHGLNLQHGGHTIVWTSLPWSLEEWEQANKRLARQGQKHPVVIHSLMGGRTIDHLIHAALLEKTSVQRRLLEFLESPV